MLKALLPTSEASTPLREARPAPSLSGNITCELQSASVLDSWFLTTLIGDVTFSQELAHDLTTEPAAENVLLFLVTRTSSLLRRAYDDAITPYFRVPAPAGDPRPRVSLAIPSPNLRVDGFASSDINMANTTTTSRPASPSLRSSNTSFRGGPSTTAGPFYSHANRGIGSSNSGHAYGDVSHENAPPSHLQGHSRGAASAGGSQGQLMGSSSGRMVRVSEESLQVSTYPFTFAIKGCL